MNSKRPRNTEHLALLSAYVEPFASGQRVVIVGDGAAKLGERLLELGALRVHAYELVAPSVAASIPGLVVKTLPDNDLDVRDGAFDLAVMPDAASLPSPESVFSRVRRWVGENGIVVAGCSAVEGEGLGYYELYDLVSLRFTHVSMVGQVPFNGATLAVLGEEGEPEVTVDTQLAGDAAPPTRFLAIGSQVPIDVRPYVILQLPDAGRAVADTSDVARERAALAEAKLKADVLETQLEEQRRRALEAGEAARRFEQELSRRDERIVLLEDVARSAEEAARVMQARLAEAEQSGVAFGELELRARARDVEFGQALARVVELEQVLARIPELEVAAVKAEQTAMIAAALEAELIELADAHAGEVAALEEALRERGRAIQTLEREVARRERMIKELLIAVEHAAPMPSEPPPARPLDAPNAPAQHATEEEMSRLLEERSRLRGHIETLSQDAARREGELQALKWRIDELSLTRGDQTPAPPAPEAEAVENADVAALRDEIDMLRQALRQEHDARVRAEAAVSKDPEGASPSPS